MGAFDFIGGVARYRAAAQDIARLDLRHRFLVAPFHDVLQGARVLDLGAHDGRWSYALSQAGAAEVVGIEARPELIARLAEFPDTPARARIDLRHGDLHEALDAFARDGERFDVVALFGIFYHVMDHFRVLDRIRALGPRAVIIDGEFMKGANPFIQLVREDPTKDLNAAPQVPGQAMAIKGIPSGVAMERMAEALGFAHDWLDWDAVAPADRGPVGDYYRGEGARMIRRTCVLRPA